MLGGEDDPGAPAAARAAVGDTARSSGATWWTATRSNGTLGYADSGTLLAGASGTITSLRDPGSVVERGEALYDARRRAGGVPALRALPAWRDFTP